MTMKNVACGVENVGPGDEVVKLGRISPRTARGDDHG